MTETIPLTWFGDQRSQEIYQALSEGRPFQNTQDFPDSMMELNPYYQETLQQVKKLDVDHLKEVVIYGAGGWGRRLFQLVFSDRPKINVRFCDQKGAEMALFCYCDVLTPEELVADFSHLPVIVAMEKHQEEVQGFLQKNQVNQVYFFGLERAQKHQPTDFWSPEIEGLEDYVWVGNLPQASLLEQIILSSVPIQYEKTSDIFLFTPQQGKNFLTEGEKSHYNSKQLAPENYGLLFKKEQYLLSWGKDLQVPLSKLDQTVTFYRASHLKVNLGAENLPFFQGAKATLQGFEPSLSITYHLKTEDHPWNLGETESLISWLKEQVPSYQFTLRLQDNENLLCYAVSKETEGSTL